MRASLWPARIGTVGIFGLAAGLGAELGGNRMAVLALLGTAAAFALLRFLLPSAAHAAFARGAFAEAARRYRLIALTAWFAPRRLHAELSLAAVALAAGELERAERILEGFDGARLEHSARAVWLNNRAYARLRQGTRLEEAWQLSTAAMALRPDVPGIRHTHGLALLLRGQIDAAIATLDELHRMSELPPALEAERCADLARAWSDKGEAAYAAEYRGRAALARHRRV
jgi:tetratricopeptide (TPR) repeat protein